MSVVQAIASALSSRRDVFNRQGIPAEGLMGPGWGGIRVDQQAATAILAIHATWGLLADSAGLLPADVVQTVKVKGEDSEEGEQRIPLERPDWLEYPDPNDPNITTEEHFSQVVMAMVSDGNSFTLALPEVADPAELRVLDPQRIECKRVGRDPVYIYRPEGGGREDLGADQIIHVSRLRRPGQLRGLSPIDEAAQSLGKTRAADRFGNRIFTAGMLLAGAMTVPGPLDKTQTELLRDEITKVYTGMENAGKPGIFANGATFSYPAIDVEALQLLEVLRWGVLDIARLYHVPPHLAGDNAPGAVSYKSVEHLAIEYVEHAVKPYAIRIERVYSRLLPGRDINLKFNLAALLRGDHITRFQAYQIGLANKFLKVDEVRALEDLAPIGNPPGTGDGGLLQTPNNNAPGSIQIPPDTSNPGDHAI